MFCAIGWWCNRCNVDTPHVARPVPFQPGGLMIIGLSCWLCGYRTFTPFPRPPPYADAWSDYPEEDP